MKRQTASKAVPGWARLRAQVPHPQHSAAHRHTTREHPDVATPTSHLHCHTRTHSGVHRLRTSHQRLFYVKGSNQTTWQDLRAISSSQLPSQKPWSSGLWGTPGGEYRQPPPKTLLHRGAPDRHRGARPAGSPRQVCAHPLGQRTTSWEQDRSHHPVSDAHSPSSTARESTPSSRHTTSNPGAHHRGDPGSEGPDGREGAQAGAALHSKMHENV